MPFEGERVKSHPAQPSDEVNEQPQIVACV
jgi:hypothetical protein